MAVRTVHILVLSLLFACQGALVNCASAKEGMQTVDGKADSKVEESDWIDITADVNAADESNQDTEEENLEGLDFQLEGINTSFQPNDDEGVEPLQDGDDDSHGDPTEQPTEESSESDFPVSEMSEDAFVSRRRRVCQHLSSSLLRSAICKVGVPFLELYTNYVRFPSYRRGRVRIYGLDISGTKIRSCSVTGGRNRKTVRLGQMYTQAFGRYRYKRGWFRIKGRVTVRFWISYMHMTFTHGEMADGCPTVSNVRCSAKIRRVRVKVRGGLLGRIINLFRGPIGRIIKRRLDGLICRAGVKFMTSGGPQILKTLTSI